MFLVFLLFRVFWCFRNNAYLFYISCMLVITVYNLTFCSCIYQCLCVLIVNNLPPMYATFIQIRHISSVQISCLFAVGMEGGKLEPVTPFFLIQSCLKFSNGIIFSCIQANQLSITQTNVDVNKFFFRCSLFLFVFCCQAGNNSWKQRWAAFQRHLHLGTQPLIQNQGNKYSFLFPTYCKEKRLHWFACFSVAACIRLN